MGPITLPVPTIDDLMRSLGITDEEILEDLLYPADPSAAGAWARGRAGSDA